MAEWRVGETTDKRMGESGIPENLRIMIRKATNRDEGGEEKNGSTTGKSGRHKRKMIKKAADYR